MRRPGDEIWSQNPFWGVVSGEQQRNRPAMASRFFVHMKIYVWEYILTMLTFFSSQQKYKYLSERAQAMIEFAIVFPILMMLLIGIFEIGRLVFIYSAVNNASREAVRYGSAIGYDDAGEIKYKNCAGIREMARRSAYFMNLQDADITIEYDRPDPNTGIAPAPYHACQGTVDPGYFIQSGDRVLVTVTGQYRPYTLLLPFGQRTIESRSARTILGFVDLLPPASPTSSGGGGGGGSTPTATNSPAVTDTASPTATATDMPTATATYSGPMPDTVTPLPTTTETQTPTETPSTTPSSTPTTVPACGGIITSPISINGTPQMSMTITNPYDFSVTVQDIEMTWNAASGATGNGTLTLNSASVGAMFWVVSNTSGDFTITPSATLDLPGNGAISTITFTFADDYENVNGSESIVINLSTPGCESSPIRRP